MKVTYNWLKELVEITASPQEVAKRLTLAGLEVEGLETRTIPKGVIVAHVLEVKEHTDADHLSICSVDTGKGDPLQIVCGAPNVKEGEKYPLATVGTSLAPDFTVKKAKLRGVESMGMLCSERELGISDDHEGIMTLSQDFETGKPLHTYFENDTVIEIDLTPNRGDCLSVLGVAREVSAQFSAPLKEIILEPKESADSVERYIKVTIDDPEGCPRYMGRLVTGVTIKESPQWLKNRLTPLGIRPISNVVDITNYILLLFGQPMHAFDYATIANQEIIVKRAKEGQKFTTLDDIERTLVADDLLICDGQEATALAGVMGGAGSGITEETTDVFLECAFFNPVGIRKTSKRLDLSSDSSYRFERGVDPTTGCEKALDTAAEMIRQLAGGTIAKGVIDECPKPIEKRKISLRPLQVTRLLGVTIPKETIISSLSSIGIELLSGGNDQLTFEVPTYRHDLVQEVDLIEEAGRLFGYDNIPAGMNAVVSMNTQKNHVEFLTNTIRTSLAAQGLNETVTNSMTSEMKCTLLTPEAEAVVLLNPLNPDMSRMRTTILGSQLDVIAYNLNRKNTNNRIFEIGRKFIGQGINKQPLEPETLSIVLEGDFYPASWNSKKQVLDFYILKGILASLCRSLSIPEFTYSTLTKGRAGYFEAESAQISGTDITGVCGKVKTEILKSFGIKSTVYYAEIIISDLLKNGLGQLQYSALPRHPAVERDFCFVMKEGLLSATVTNEIYGLSELVEKVTPFDVYRGEKLPAGKKSIAFSVHFRAQDRTLKEDEAESLCEKIITTMKSKYEATLRE